MKINNSILAAQPFLKGMDEKHLELLLDNSMSVEFPADKLIFREGQLANRFYLILEGEVALECAAQNGNGSKRIQTIGSGEPLGWSWLFPPYYWHFDARAVKPTEAIFIYGTRVRELCESDHDLGYELMKRTAEMVIGRLHASRRQIAEAK